MDKGRNQGIDSIRHWGTVVIIEGTTTYVLSFLSFDVG
jgi:hypothetical protein